jgi:hypothetical protein
LQPGRRTRRLYDGDPLPNRLGPHARAVLRQSWDDLAEPAERRELGLGLFIDRPLAGGKHPAEPDATLLLASSGYSRSVAEARLRALAAEVGVDGNSPEVEALRAGLDVEGLPLDAIGPAARPGSVTLADARRAAADFVFLGTTPAGVEALRGQFDFLPLGEIVNLDFLDSGRVLVARSAGGPGMVLYDEALRPRVELEVPAGEGYVSRAGLEYPAGGLLAVRVWRPEGEVIDLPAAPVRLRPR